MKTTLIHATNIATLTQDYVKQSFKGLYAFNNNTWYQRQLYHVWEKVDAHKGGIPTEIHDNLSAILGFVSKETVDIAINTLTGFTQVEATEKTLNLKTEKPSNLISVNLIGLLADDEESVSKRILSEVRLYTAIRFQGLFAFVEGKWFSNATGTWSVCRDIKGSLPAFIDGVLSSYIGAMDEDLYEAVGEVLAVKVDDLLNGGVVKAKGVPVAFWG